MAETQSDIRREIETTRAAMAEKIEMLEKRESDLVEGAKRLVNPRYQAKQHPWLMMGVSVFAGYLLNHMLLKGSSATNGRKRRPALHQDSTAGSSQIPLERPQRKKGMVQSVATAVVLSLLRELESEVVRKARTHSEKDRPSQVKSSAS